MFLNKALSKSTLFISPNLTKSEFIDSGLLYIVGELGFIFPSELLSLISEFMSPTVEYLVLFLYEA